MINNQYYYLSDPIIQEYLNSFNLVNKNTPDPIGTVIPEYAMYRLFEPPYFGPVSAKCTYSSKFWDRGQEPDQQITKTIQKEPEPIKSRIKKSKQNPERTLFEHFNPKSIKNRFRSLLSNSTLNELAQKINDSEFLHHFFNKSEISYSELTHWLKESGYKFQERPWRTKTEKYVILMIQDSSNLIYKVMMNHNNQEARCELTHLTYLVNDIPPTSFGRSSSIAKIASVSGRISICPIGFSEHSSIKEMKKKRPEWNSKVSPDVVHNFMSTYSKFILVDDSEILAAQYENLESLFPKFTAFSTSVY